MLSRSPSPPKSPKRHALSSKDGNIRQPLTKSYTPQLSPHKSSSYIPRSSTSPSRTPSPLKSKPAASTIFKSQVPPLGFTIFSDPKDYSADLQLASSSISEDQNDLTHHKENITPNSPIRSAANKRKALADLSILDYAPGYIHYNKYTKSVPVQLDEQWTNSKYEKIPSYITPPRDNRTRYISFETEKPKQIKRSNSNGDIDTSKVVKKLVFDICKD